MTHQAFVDWIRLTPQTEPEEGREYLVVEQDDGTASYVIGKYMKKGHKVSLEKTPEQKEKDKKPVSEMTAEERLLECIFGGSKIECFIPDDGFYVITKDYGTDEDQYPGCAEIPVCCGKTKDCDTFYSELPIEPEGLKHPYEAERETQLQIERIKKEAEERHAIEEEERRKAIELAIAEGGLIDRITGLDKADADTKERCSWHRKQDIQGKDITDIDGNIHKDCIEFPGCIFKNDKDERDRIYAAAAQAVEIYTAFSEKYTEKDIISAFAATHTGDTKTLETIQFDLMKTVEDMDKIGVRNKRNGKYMTLLVYTFLDSPYMSGGNRGSACWLRRLKRRQWFKNLDVAEQIVIVDAMFHTGMKLRRCSKLYSIEAPAIILANELRILFENMYYLLGKIQGYNDGFESHFGYNIQGEWVGYGEDEEYSAEEEDVPEFPKDLPERDELGEPIPYMYNGETKKWEDQRSDDEIEEAREKGAEMEKTAERIVQRIKDLSGKKYDSFEDFVKELNGAGVSEYGVFAKKLKEWDDKLLATVFADTGVYSVAVKIVFTLSAGKGFGYQGFECTKTEGVTDVLQKGDIIYKVVPN